MGLICPDGVSFCPDYQNQPLFFTQQSQTPFWDMYVHKTPPTPSKNTPFPGLILKMGKMNYCLGKIDPNMANFFKSCQTFLEVGNFYLFIFICVNVCVCQQGGKCCSCFGRWCWWITWSNMMPCLYKPVAVVLA